MKKPPLISVVIPAYNEEKYIGKCLSSINSQTFKDFEIIVVDNNSNDKTAEIATKLGAKVVKEKIQGMTPAREKGFKEANAEIIARTDADSTPPPNWLNDIYQTFSTHPDVIAITGSFTSPYNYLPNELFHYFIIGFVHLTKILTGHIPLHGPNFALKKSAWEKIKVHMDDSIVHEDIDLSCHLSKVGNMLFLPHLTIPYSLRRWRKNFFYTIVEYPTRYMRTIRLHHN